jgi:hypothetical protein
MRIHESIPLTNGSGSGFRSGTDPDPDLDRIRILNWILILIRILLFSSVIFKTSTKFFLLLYENIFTSFFKDKKS